MAFYVTKIHEIHILFNLMLIFWHTLLSLLSLLELHLKTQQIQNRKIS